MKKSRLPEGFAVTQRIKELAEMNGWPNPYTEIEAFKDYHLAHGSTMADWEAAFRTWLRNANKWNRQGGKQVAPTRVQAVQRQRQVAELVSPAERQANQRKLAALIQVLANKKAV